MGNCQSEVPDRVKEILCRETEFTPGQVERLYQRFKMLDVKQQGFLLKADLLESKEFAKNKIGPRIIDTMYNVTNCEEGKMTFEQFIRLLSLFQPVTKKCPQYRTHKLLFAFKLYDWDDDDLIDYHDFRTMLDTFIGDSVQESEKERMMDRIFEEVDVDRNGKLSFEEFSVAMERTNYVEKLSIRFIE